ncbi:MAG: hypothetical protein AB7E81_03770 [Hyphomicrobiaceae bacterium]
MVTGDGAVVPFEIVDTPKGSAVEFIANLPAGAKTTYRLKPALAPAGSDLFVEEKADAIRMTNDHGGVALRTKLADDEGPILAFRTLGGTWSGGSRVLPHAIAGSVVDYEAKIERRGPVAVVVFCRAVFASGLVWKLRLTMQAGDPSIVLDEQWSAWEHPTIEIEPGDASHLDQLYFRKGVGSQLGQIAVAPIAPEKGDVSFELEPWLQWWMRERRGTWVTLHGDSTSDAVSIAALRADLWIEPADILSKRKLEPLQIIRRDGRPVVSLPGTGSRRQILIATMPREIAVDRGIIGKRLATPAQRLVIKHGNLPLDRVKDMRLEWPHARDKTHSRLLLTNEDVQRLRSGPPPVADRLARLRAGALNEFLLADHLDAALRSNDPGLRAKLSAAAVPAMQAAVNAFVEQNDYVSFGTAPQGQRYILYAVHLADFALSDPATDDATRRRLFAQAAFLSYLVHRPDYWSPARRLAANPNMTSIVAGYQGLLACLLHDHPQSGEWLDAALKELFNDQLLTWSDENGGWLEAPHYAMLSYDHMLAVFACTRNLGRGDYLFHPRMRKVIEWLAKITTPPDARIDGRRHLPPIGNTYMLEPTGQFGTIASLWRTRDPAFSAEMQWMHLRSGSPIFSGVGGYSPAMGPYQMALKDSTLPAQKPDYASELFPRTGAVLRNHFGTERETQMHIIAGSNHAHYDYDSGSITIWGKGRLISDDFGYYGRAPMSDHSMVESKHRAGIMRIERFATFEAADFLQGRSGAWTRQVAFLKSREPTGPSYFVLRDELDRGATGTWRLYFAADRIEIHGDRAVAIGREDVDTDVFFLTGRPHNLSTEVVTRISAASGFNKPHATTQTALIASLAGKDNAIAVLIYPRLKGTPSPNLQVEQNGRVVRVEAEHSVRTVLVSLQARRYVSDGIKLEGTLAAVTEEADVRFLALGDKGRVSAFGQELTAAPAARRLVAR